MTVDAVVPELLRDRVLAVVGALQSAGIAHAVGGALAYGYAGVPRATTDIDVNVFVSETMAERTLRVLGQLGIPMPGDSALAQLEREGQIRLLWDTTYVDLFFAYHEFHQECARRTRRVPFAGIEIDVLSAEDIVVFKMMFNRTRDWGDIERVVQVQRERLDLVYIRRWVQGMVGSDDGRLARLDEVARDAMSRPP